MRAELAGKLGRSVERRVGDRVGGRHARLEHLKGGVTRRHPRRLA
jgi:hypothetical protein